MNAFRKDGVYLKLYDAVKEGYCTMGKDGKEKHHRYGLLDKLYDIHTYGKTRNISYGYIYFCNSEFRTNGETLLYIGSIQGELTEIIETWQIGSNFGYQNHHHWKNYSLLNENTIKYLDRKNRECYLTSLRDGNLVIQDYFDFNNGDAKINEYRFYLLPV